ncbi:hypothetical protein FQN55_007690 [Onygenales sp. PD_40]|nr:hypothetical protein FQN55_007690 [Onygenales sp. PD_40]KAK2789970.1 hypothetical protein FQN52_005778 [Onygenales sp. PD_12]KAK2791032.1 hypothetical protein FQN53_007221 [Emmonsiellopsis sp. PD_33]
MRPLIRFLKSHRGAISIVSVLVAIFLYFFFVDTTLNSAPSTTNPLSKSSKAILSSKSLIVASLKDDDTSWIREYLADWHANIYVVDDPRAELTVPMNKGREAMVYLTYIIDNYDKLPDIMVFIHGKRYQWHNDDPVYDSVPILTSLRLPHVYSVGYAPLRCAWVPGCPDEIHPLNPSLTSLTINPSEEVPDRLKAEAAYASAFQEIFPNARVPSVVGAPCSSQFAVTRERVRMRGRAEYERVRRWLVETELEDRVAGRVLEYLWHSKFDLRLLRPPF